MGGAMRQSGFLSAAGSFALKNHVARLAEDHRRAQILADALEGTSNLVVERIPVRTNMVFFEVPDRISPENLEQELLRRGLRVSRVTARRFRAVTHLDFCDDQLERAIEIFKTVAAGPVSTQN